MNELDEVVHKASVEFVQALTPADLENAKARYLGKSGVMTDLMRGLAALGPEDKKSRGAQINKAKQAIEAALNDRRQALADLELQT
ncbi:MAG: phenylalanine--tRNA ligase subunit alpha, partial [Betaproteobacteria bacterium]|nr:phenylalanine--tRNA ligase subunit alpha [Betaproteobacteria bacterium]